MKNGSLSLAPAASSSTVLAKRRFTFTAMLRKIRGKQQVLPPWSLQEKACTVYRATCADRTFRWEARNRRETLGSVVVPIRNSRTRSLLSVSPLYANKVNEMKKKTFHKRARH